MTTTPSLKQAIVGDICEIFKEYLHDKSTSFMVFPTKWLTEFFTVFYTKFQNTHHFNYANLLYVVIPQNASVCDYLP